jgi:hypothetical protein
VLKLAPSVLATEPERPVQDFTGRRPVSGSVTGIETTREGGLLVAAGNALYLAPAKSRRTLVAIRGARVAERSITVVLDATRAGRATVAVALAGEPVARTTRRITAGRTRVRVRGPFDAQPHEVRVTVRAARDEVRLHLGTRLPMAYARRLAEWWEEYEEPVAGCRRLSVRRIDCAYGTAAAGCARVESLTLRRTGVLWVRSYGCADPADPYRRRPQWSWWAQPIGAPIP